MVSPVAGFRPSRAFRSALTSFPNPGSTNSPFDFTSREARVDNSSKNSLTWARFIPVDSEKWLITSDCVMRFLPVAALVAMSGVTPPTRTRLKSKPDTHISHSSRKVFIKTSISLGFLRIECGQVDRPRRFEPPTSRSQFRFNQTHFRNCFPERIGRVRTK